MKNEKNYERITNSTKTRWYTSNKNNNQTTPNFEKIVENLKYLNGTKDFYHLNNFVKSKDNNHIGEDLKLIHSIIIEVQQLKDRKKELLEQIKSIPDEINLNILNLKNAADANNINVMENVNKISQSSNDLKNSKEYKTVLDEVQMQYDNMGNYATIFKNISIDLRDKKNKNEILKKFKDTTDEMYKNEFFKPFIQGKFLAVDELLNKISEISEINELIYKELREKKIAFTAANRFKDRDPEKDYDLYSFLKTKTDSNEVRNPTITLYFEGTKFDQFYYFDDKSFLIKDRKGNYTDINSMKEVVQIQDYIMKDYIQEEFPKNPFIAREIYKIYKEQKESFAIKGQVELLVKSVKDNITILKQNDYNIAEAYQDKAKDASDNNGCRAIELMDDEIHKIVRTHKVKNYAESIISNKYRHLYNEDTYAIMGDLFDLEITGSQLQDYIGKKIAAYKNPEQFNEALTTFFKSFNEFAMDALKSKAESLNTEIISDTDNILILKIDNYEQCKAIGSASWCIVRDKSYFESYTDEAEQYIIFDFNKDSKKNDSVVGLTSNEYGNISAAHYKDDEQIDCDDEDISYYMDIIMNAKQLDNKAKIEIKNFVI